LIVRAIIGLVVAIFMVFTIVLIPVALLLLILIGLVG
jgi:hypothetical protein